MLQYYLWVHQNERKLSRNFATKSAQEELDLNSIRDNNTECITIFWVWESEKERTIRICVWMMNICESLALDCTYKVVEAKLLSSRFNWPSKAIPWRLELLDNNGTRYMVFCRVEPGWIGHPSLVSIEATVLRYCPFWNKTTSTPCWTIALTFLTTLFELFRTTILIPMRSPWKYNCLSNVTSSSSSPGLSKKSLRTTVHGWEPCLLGAYCTLRIPKVKVLRRWVRSVSFSPVNIWILMQFFRIIKKKSPPEKYFKKNLLWQSRKLRMVRRHHQSLVAKSPRPGTMVEC